MFDPSAEIVSFLIKVSFTMFLTTTDVMIYWASCPRETVGNQVCDDLHTYPETHILVQQTSARNLLVNRAFHLLTYAIALPALGVWSDKVGRKDPMLLSALGNLAATLICMGATIRFKLALIIINVGTFVGSAVCMGAPVFVVAYIIDRTAVEERTHRLAILYGFNFIGNLFGYLLAALLLQYFQYSVVLCVALGIMALTVVVIVVRIEKDRQGEATSCTVPKKSEPDEKKPKLVVLKEWILSLFAVLFRSRPKHGRRLLVVLVVSEIVTHIANTAKDDIMLLFAKSPAIDLSDAMYGYFLSVRGAAHGVCSFIFIPIMNQVATLHDVTILATGLAVHGLSSLMSAFSTTVWLLFLSGATDGLGVMTFTAYQAMETKVVSNDEVGSLLSLIESMKFVCQLVAIPVFTVIYTSSAAMFPGLTLVVFAGMYIVSWVVFASIGPWVKRNIPDGSNHATEATPLSTTSSP